MKKNLGICVTKTVTAQQLEIVKDFFNYDDLVVFSSTPQLVDDPNLGVVGPYYMTFFNGILLFTDQQDLKNSIQNIKTNEIFLLTDNSIISIDKKEMINELR